MRTWRWLRQHQMAQRLLCRTRAVQSGRSPGCGRSILTEVRPSTGEPCAGDPPARFGGRGARRQSGLPTPIGSERTTGRAALPMPTFPPRKPLPCNRESRVTWPGCPVTILLDFKGVDGPAFGSLLECRPWSEALAPATHSAGMPPFDCGFGNPGSCAASVESSAAIRGKSSLPCTV